MILAIINMMLDFDRFNRANDSSVAENMVMAIISGLIWPFMLMMDILDLMKFIYLKNMAVRNVKRIVLSMCIADSIELDSTMIKLKLKKKGNGYYGIVARNKFTQVILEHLKITDMSFKIYHE